MTTNPTPTGWQIRPLGDLCDHISDGTHYTPRYVVHGVPFYSVETVTNDDFVNVKYISREEHRNLTRRCRPRRGDILMTRIGSLADTRLLDWDVDASIYVSLALLRPGNRISPRYLYAYTKSQAFVRGVEDLSLLWAVPKKINMGDIRKVEVRFPKDAREQEAIADALIDAEHSVKSLQSLIAKKQAIKQGMMQQLLTGRTRFSGFISPWTEAELQQVAVVDPETLSAGTNPGAAIDYISLEDVSRGTILRSSRLVFKDAPSRARRVLRHLDVLFGTVRPNLQSHAIYQKGLTRPIASTGFAVVRALSGSADPAFLFYLLMSRTATVQVDRIIAGSNYPAISSTDVRKLRFIMPTLAEQSRIGLVLGDCDREITALLERLDKARAIKHGMMQELLTGRTRLPINKVAS